MSTSIPHTRLTNMIFLREGVAYTVLDEQNFNSWHIQVCRNHNRKVERELTCFVDSKEWGTNTLVFIPDPSLSDSERITALYESLARFQVQQAIEQCSVLKKLGRSVCH